MSDKPVLTFAEVAELIGVSTRTVERWVERREIAFVVLPGGRVRLILRADLDTFLAAFRTPSADEAVDAFRRRNAQ